MLIDTSVWSLGLCRRKRDLRPEELKTFYAWDQILTRGDAVIIGPIRQEILSGLATSEEFEIIKSRLANTPDLDLSSETYELAASYFNACRSTGVAPGAIDMTICAAAHEHGVAIFTTDADFVRYAVVLPIRLYEP